MAKTPHDRASHPKRVPNGPAPLIWGKDQMTKADYEENKAEMDSKNWAKYGPDAAEDNAERAAAHAADKEANS